MARKTIRPLDKPRLIQLFAGDVERLQRFLPGIQVNRAIRELIHTKLNELELRITQPVEVPDDQIDPS